MEVQSLFSCFEIEKIVKEILEDSKYESNIQKVAKFVNNCYSKSLYYWAKNDNSHVINNRMPLGYSHQETLEDLCNLVGNDQYGETIFCSFFEE